MASPYEDTGRAGTDDEDDLEIHKTGVRAGSLDEQRNGQKGDEAACGEYVKCCVDDEVGNVVRRIDDRDSHGGMSIRAAKGGPRTTG